MTEFTDFQIDVLEALADSAGARTPDELARQLGYSAGAIADTLEQFRRERWTERLSAWQLASGAEYALRSHLTLTGYQVDIMRDLQNASGARTVDELALDSGDDQELITETIDWLARNGYVQPVSAYRRIPGAGLESSPVEYDPYGDQYETDRNESGRYEPAPHEADRYEPEQYDPDRYNSELFQLDRHDPSLYKPAAYEPDPYGAAQHESAPYEAAPYEPVSQETTRYEPALYETTRYEPPAFEQAQYEPAAFEQAQYEPAAFEPARYEPAAFEPAQYESAAFEPAQYEPAPFEQAQYEPAPVDQPDLYETGLIEPDPYRYDTDPIGMPRPEHTPPARRRVPTWVQRRD
ncbi:hypothetical protein [Nocardia alni]|uniref:hypothetical protein n=1 Tax=Nocardia alni TaxID=2815723 RepID=UPI001C24C8EE|nr:hypothetical protein [Nocardia alni]